MASKRVDRAGAARPMGFGKKSGKPRISQAMVLGGLLLFGTIFGAGTLALRSGELMPGEYGQGTFAFTDAFLYGGSDNQVVVITASRNNEPLADEPVSISFTNSSGTYQLLSGSTNGQGILDATIILPVQPTRLDSYPGAASEVTLTIKAAGETIEKKLLVYNQASTKSAFGSPTDSFSGVVPIPGPSAIPPKLYLTLDKPRYQPGQTIHLRTLSFKEGAAITDDVTYQITDPNGNKLFRTTLTANKFGITFMDYPISEILPLGEFRITVNTTTNTAIKVVPIERYVLPKFGIDFNGMRSWYGLDEDILGSLEAKYFFGKPVDGKAKVTARLYSEEVGWYRNAAYSVDRQVLNITIDVKGGNASFTVPKMNGLVNPPSHRGIQYGLVLSAEVTDTGGHSERKNTTIMLSPDSFYFTAIMETPTPGQPYTATVVVRDPMGDPVKGASVVLNAPDGKQLGNGRTDGRGLAPVTFTYDFQQHVQINVSLDDPAKVQSEDYYLSGPSAIKLVPDKRFYQAGETARVTVLADPKDDNGGVAGIVMISVLSGGQTFVQKELSLQGYRTSFSFAVKEEMLPTLEVQAGKLSMMSYSSYWDQYNYYGYYKGAPAQRSTSNSYSDKYTMAGDRIAVGVGVLSQLNLTVAASKSTLRPGEEVQLLLAAFNGSSPVSAAVAIGIVDEALLSMGGGSSFDEIRDDLQQDPGYEQYSIYSYVWGADVMVKRAAPMFISAGFYDYRPETGMLSYSSINKVGAQTSDEPSQESISKLSIGMALLGVLGYFAILGLGIKYRRTGIAVLASLVLLAAVVPGVVQLAAQPKAREFSDITQPLSFSVYTQGSSQSSYSNEDSNSWGGGGIPPPTAPTGNRKGASEQFGTPASDGGFSRLLDIAAPSNTVTVRTWFPELWYWNPMVVTGDNGLASIMLRAPDSITTWRIDALASTTDGRIGVGNGSMAVFQPFFVDPDLPVSVVRNDKFAFKVLIYNYEADAKQVAVKLAPADWFQVLGTDTVTAVVGANSVSSVMFVIRATKVGTRDLTVTGSTDTQQQDTVVKQLRVEPDGKLLEDIRNGLLTNSAAADLLFQLSGNRIAGSENAYLKLQSSLESIIIDGADGFINVVSGCGEQSTSGLSVDILAYQNYLKGKPDARNLTRYQDILNRGIQHEAQYLSTNTNGHGRAIVWHTGEQPDIWLTAWAIQAYKNLREAGFTVDDRIIPDLQTYLVSQQQADGSWKFPDVGHWSINPELESYGVAASAYIVRALLISGMSPSSTAISGGVSYIEKNLGGVKSDFTRALSLDALELAGGSASVRGQLVSQLTSSARDGGNGVLYWSYSDAGSGSTKTFYYRSDNTIETTGYAVMALARGGAGNAVVQAGAKYLVLQRGAGGFYGSTHNTAVAFTALNSLAEIAPLKDVTVDVLVNGAVVDTVHIGQDNKDLTFLTDMRPWFVSSDGQTAAKTVTVGLRSSGEGGVFYHLYAKQHLEWAQVAIQPVPQMSFSVNYSATSVSVGEVVSASAHVGYTGMASGVQMVLVDLKAPTGFVLDENDFIDLLAAGKISFYELRGGKEALVYLDSLKRNETRSMDYTLTAMSASTSLLQHVNAFDMYNTTLKVELAPMTFASA